MGADLASGNNPDGSRESGDTADFHIPSPRPPVDDHIENLPKTRSDDPMWWYDQPRKRGGDRRFWGEVEWIGGPEGDRLREKLTEIVRDLLDWAHTEQRNSETDSDSDTGSDAVSGEDGDTDDTRA